jgi:hypothetical protein
VSDKYSRALNASATVLDANRIDGLHTQKQRQSSDTPLSYAGFRRILQAGQIYTILRAFWTLTMVLKASPSVWKGQQMKISIARRAYRRRRLLCGNISRNVCSSNGGFDA